MDLRTPGKCPVCNSKHGQRAMLTKAGNTYRVDCPSCGDYIITEDAIEDHLAGATAPKPWSDTKRAALSHLIRTGRDLPRYNDTRLPYLDSGVLNQFEADGLVLPLPSEQFRNLIRYFGNEERRTGEAVKANEIGQYAIIGAANPEALVRLVYAIQDQNFVRLIPAQYSPMGFAEGVLTLRGWFEWETIQAGRQASPIGFLAMQFGDSRVDEFMRVHVQGTVADAVGMPVHRVDSADLSRAGVIDNIMRAAITDAAFVLVELSHGNRGAYWEAGFAEGLGKPVIYLCEQSAWDDPERRPHFDVNHCTTVMWDEKNADQFCRQLSATIRNSLVLQAVAK